MTVSLATGDDRQPGVGCGSPTHAEKPPVGLVYWPNVADPTLVGRGRTAVELDYVNRKLVYVAAPYTRPDPVENTHRLILSVDRIARDGVVTPVAPHLTMLWHLVVPRAIEFWYAYDLAILARCDAVLRLDGDSTGADREVAFASSRQIPVFFDSASLYTWAQQNA